MSYLLWREVRGSRWVQGRCLLLPDLNFACRRHHHHHHHHHHRCHRRHPTTFQFQSGLFRLTWGPTMKFHVRMMSTQQPSSSSSPSTPIQTSQGPLPPILDTKTAAAAPVSPLSSPRTKSSSKVEETVKRLKQRQLEKLEELSRVKELEKEVESVIDQDLRDPKIVQTTPSSPSSSSVQKKGLWTRVVDEVKHYYHGFRLLFLDVKVSSKIIRKVLQGRPLTRRENKQLVRTVSDLFRLVPFSVFVIVPFMEFLLPVALKLFPGMLPSTFTTSSERDNKMRRALKAKLEYARFLQRTLDEMGPQTSKDRSSQSAKDFFEFYSRVKSGQEKVTNEEILKFSKLFEDEITLDNMTRGQLVAVCRLLELTPFGNNNFLRFQIEMKLRHLKSDDRVIQKEGIDNLTVQELQTACKERGMRALGLSQEALKLQLSQWLALSLNAKVPPSLLLLSRTLYLPETLDTPAKIAATISVLPESAATQTKAQIGEREGKIENITRLEVIKEEQRKIEEEAAAKEKKIVDSVAAQILPEKKAVKEKIEKIVSPIVETVINAEKEKERSVLSSAVNSDDDDKKKELSVDDFNHLKTAIETLAEAKTEALVDEKEELGDIKKELQDYEEDIEDLKSVKVEANRHDIHESIAAKILFNKVNSMVKRADVIVESLHKKEREFAKKKESEGSTKIDEEHLMTVQELINSVQQIQKTLDSSKLEQISEVLSHMDVDADGVINVDHVLKVIDVLCQEQINLSERQIRQIIDMLEKEEMLEVEDKIEAIFGRTEMTTAGQPPDKIDLKFDDTAKDLSGQEQEAHIKEMFREESSKKPVKKL